MMGIEQHGIRASQLKRRLSQAIFVIVVLVSGLVFLGIGCLMPLVVFLRVRGGLGLFLALGVLVVYRVVVLTRWQAYISHLKRVAARYSERGNT